jgi:predicted nucleic-acid-binding protein
VLVIGLDTNVLVRYLAQDDPAQSARASQLMEQGLSKDEPGYIGLVVLAETSWVLLRRYSATAEEIREMIADLLGTRQIVVENRAAVSRALTASLGNNCAFTDALIAACAVGAGCTKVVSFDRGAARAGMTLLT